jgi:outer membrane beta-barrel protein
MTQLLGYKSIVLQAAFVLLFCSSIQAQKIADDQISKENLTFETVNPQVEFPVVVINRTVKTERRIDLALDIVQRTDDLFNENINFGVRGGYFIDTDWALGLQYVKLNTELNQYAKLFESKGLSFNRTPTATSLIGLYANQALFYGKISLAADVVYHQMLVLRYVLGATAYDTQDYLPYLQVGAGWQTFFNRSFYFELGYGISVYQFYNPVSRSIKTTDPVVSKKDFSKEIQVSQSLSTSIGVLF